MKSVSDEKRLEHAPAPWNLDPYSCMIRAKDDQAHICDIRGAGCTDAEVRGNIQLMLNSPKMYAALKRIHANIERWLETGKASGPEESKSIYEQIDEAIKSVEAFQDVETDVIMDAEIPAPPSSDSEMLSDAREYLEYLLEERAWMRMSTPKNESYLADLEGLMKRISDRVGQK